MYYVYILRCSDDSFYVGSTRDLSNRVNAHNVGRASAYTLKRRPVCLMYSESYHTQSEAIRRERQLKRWSAEKKKSLISGDIVRLSNA